MKNFYPALLAVLASGNPAGAQTSWVFDPSNSSVVFHVTSMGISEITGVFKDFGGEVTTTQKDFTNAFVSFFINTRSIDTNNPLRDNKLISSEFFGSAKYPSIRFVSTDMTKTKDGNYKLKGTLSIKEKSKPVELHVEYGGLTTDDGGNIRIGFKVTGAINRFDYGLDWNEMLDRKTPVAGEKVEFTCFLQLVKQE